MPETMEVKIKSGDRADLARLLADYYETTQYDTYPADFMRLTAKDAEAEDPEEKVPEKP